MSELGDWYANYARMPMRTRLMSLLQYIVAGALGFAAIDSLTGGSLMDGLAPGLYFGASFGALTVFVFPAVVVWWRGRQTS